MYRILQEEGIDLPRYAVLNRDPDKPDGQSAPVTPYCIHASLYSPNLTWERQRQYNVDHSRHTA